MIRPQDKRPDVAVTLTIPAALNDQLTEYGRTIASDVEYVVSAIVTEYFERNKPKATKERKPKQLKRAA